MTALDIDAIHELPLQHRVLGPILRARADRDPERVYIRFGASHWTFKQTDDIVRDAARGFMGLGLSKGERVGLFMPNHPGFIFAWYATNLAGGVTVPINPSFTASLLQYILEDSDVRGLVTTAALLPVVAALSAERREQLRFVVLVDEVDSAVDACIPSVLAFAELIKSGKALGGPSEVPLDFTDVHSIMYTSGTTGPSKGAIVPNGHYFGSSCTFLRAVNLTRDDVLYTPLPLFHGLASRLGALPALMVGAEYVLAPHFSVTRFWQDVTECKASVAHTIFTLPAMLKGRPPGPYDKAHRLRAMYNGNYDQEFEVRFNVRVCEAYGLTEVGLTHYTRFAQERRPGSCGKTHEDWEARVVDSQGLEVQVNQIGEIVVRPRLPSIMMNGYVNKSDETVRVSRDLWFHTGDFGRCDSDGFFYFISRHKDRIRRRGENVSPMEVEAILCRHPDIADCAAIGFPAREGEDDIRVVLVAKTDQPPSPHAVMDWLAGRMPNFMMPRYIEFALSLPRNPVGKVEKYKLLDAGLAHDVWDRETEGYVIKRDAVPQPLTPMDPTSKENQ